MKTNAEDPCSTFEKKRSARGYSLVELLVVTAVISLILALAAPGFLALSPTRKSGIHELAGFLENARARAVAAREERIVAFAGEAFPGNDGALRHYALFAPDKSGTTSGVELPLLQLSPWRALPKGLVFGRGEHFEVENGVAFRTLHELPRRRMVPVPGSDGSDGALQPLPCLVLGPDGGVREPGFADADALHVGVIEGFVESGTAGVIVTSQRPGKNGTGRFPNGDCLGIGFYTGRARILTD